METFTPALSSQELALATEVPDFSELREMAKDIQEKVMDRWHSLQVFIGTSAVRQALAMEAAGTAVDLGLMGAGLADPLTREPIALVGDLAVLHHLAPKHEVEDESKKGKLFRSIGKPLVLMTTAIAAQKVGLHATEHFGVGQGQFGEMGTQIVSKVGAITAVNTAIDRRSSS